MDELGDYGLPVLEFWPDYGDGPLWRNGAAVNPQDLGLHAGLMADLIAYNGAYEEGRLSGDIEYVAEGVRLLAAVRRALAGRFRIIVTEPWWGDEPSEYEG